MHSFLSLVIFTRSGITTLERQKSFITCPVLINVLLWLHTTFLFLLHPSIHPLLRLSLSSNSHSCLCLSVIGTTGTGKSSTIRQVTGHTVRVSSSAESVTRQCEVSGDQSEANIVVTWPIRGLYFGHVTTSDQSEAFILVMWPTVTNQKPVYWGHMTSIDQSEASIVIIIARCSLTRGQGTEGQSG